MSDQNNLNNIMQLQFAAINENNTNLGSNISTMGSLNEIMSQLVAAMRKNTEALFQLGKAFIRANAHTVGGRGQKPWNTPGELNWAGMAQNIDLIQAFDPILKQQKTLNQGSSVLTSPQTPKMLKAFSSVIKGIPATMGSMAAAAIVMQPFMAMVSGFLEPFSMFTTTFGAFGTIMSTALYPVLIPINNALILMIPYLVQAADWLGKTGILFGVLGVSMQIVNNDLYGLKDNFTTFGSDMKESIANIFSVENLGVADVLWDLVDGFGKTLITFIGTMLLDVYEGIKEDIEAALGL